jgi:hypothetical protein
VLCSFVRNFEYSEKDMEEVKDENGNVTKEIKSISVEAQAAVTVVGRIWFEVAKIKEPELVEEAIIREFGRPDFEKINNLIERVPSPKVDLSGGQLKKANLKYLFLFEVDLSGANLRGADLIEAYLRGVYLREADLIRAYLAGADLRGADLSGADLRSAFLIDSRLNEANLLEVNLLGANLRGADLSGADLGGANLSAADLSGANLSRVKFFMLTDLLHAGAFSSEYSSDTYIEIQQLLTVKSLWEAIGIPKIVKSGVEKEKPELFVNYGSYKYEEIIRKRKEKKVLENKKTN